MYKRQGINFIDTAPAYNAGKAEQYVGETLHKLGARKEVVISTKCGNEFIDGKYVRCGSADKILRECDESLQNLKTDYIDVYLVHLSLIHISNKYPRNRMNKIQKTTPSQNVMELPVAPKIINRTVIPIIYGIS